MKVTFNITKKTCIYIGVVIALCAISFVIGRCSQPSSDTGQDLVDKIEGSLDIANDVYKDLVNAGCSIEAAEQQAKLITSFIDSMQYYTKMMEEQMETVKLQGEVNAQIVNSLVAIYTEYENSTEGALAVMIKKAEKYEEILEGLVQ